jgi:dGTPase
MSTPAHIRLRLEHDEARTLSPHAQLSSRSAGRLRPEPLDDLRTEFQRDRDRVIHCKAFRRLSGKTQVFLAPEGDHYRTRITHTMEVAQVARTITRCLSLNESLTEAIVMGHDLGHTPFGHAGEKVLAHLLPGGFHHVRQSLRVIDKLEKGGAGLNLTAEVRDGILKHSKGKGAVISDNPNLLAMTLEGQIVRLSDLIAYVNHDLDDALRAGLLHIEEVPAGLLDVLGRSHSQRLRTLVLDVTRASEASIAAGKVAIAMGPEVYDALIGLRDFLFAQVYESKPVRGEFDKAQNILTALWHDLHKNAEEFRANHWPAGVDESEGLSRAVADFLAGMTDRYAMRLYQERLMPHAWPL